MVINNPFDTYYFDCKTSTVGWLFYFSTLNSGQMFLKKKKKQHLQLFLFSSVWSCCWGPWHVFDPHDRAGRRVRLLRESSPHLSSSSSSPGASSTSSLAAPSPSVSSCCKVSLCKNYFIVLRNFTHPENQNP